MMNISSRILLRTVSLAAVTITLCATPALAGFEWTPPAEKSVPVRQNVVPAPIPAPHVEEPAMMDTTANVNSVTPEPVMMTEETIQDKALKAIENAAVKSDDSVNSNEVAAPLPDIMPAMSKGEHNIIGHNAVPVLLHGDTDKNIHVGSIEVDSDTSIIEGFGTDMPLVMALRQIVPAQYAYSFDPALNVGALVSWEGGKAWPHILQNVLESQSLQYTTHGTTLHIFKTEAAAMEKKKPSMTPM